MYRRLGCFGFLAVLALPACAADAPPRGRLPDSALPLSYALHLTIDPHAAGFSGEVRIHLRLTAAADHIWLHARELEVSRSQWLDAAGTPHAATFTTRDLSGVVEFGFGALLPPQEIDLLIDYGAAFGRKLQGLYKVTVGDEPYVVSQMEAVSARYAFPGFDEPRFKTPFDLTLTVPNAAVAVANSQPRQTDVSKDEKWKTIHFARTAPLPTYLVALAVGPWDVVSGPLLAANAVRKQPLTLRGIAAHGTGPQLHWILEQAPAIVKFFEEYTGQPYPFDKLDLLGAPDFSAGAMENAGLIVFRDAVLRIDRTSPAGQARGSFDITAHEIAHQWFGDLITVPWWNDIWLNEAFATWAQGKATTALQPAFLGALNRLEGSIAAMANDSLLSARRIRQPVDDQGDIENAFDGITYQKGAAVLRMIEAWVGADTYRRAVRAYLAHHAFASGDADDLIAAIGDVAPDRAAVKKVMHGFLDQPGIPLLHTDLQCRQGKARLTVRQSRYLPYGVLGNDDAHWSVPFCARFGRGASSDRRCFVNDASSQTFAVDGGCPDWYLPNADASGYYRFTMSRDAFAALGSRVAALEPAEQMIFADAVQSAFASGELAPADVLDAMPVLAASPFPQVAFALSGQLLWMREHLADESSRPLLDAYALKLYGARLAALGYRHVPGEADAISRMRQRLAIVLAQDMRAPSIRRALDAQGRAALGLDGHNGVDLQRVDPDLRGIALKIAVQDSGEAAFNAVLDELKTNHATQQRYELVSALGATRDARLAETARNFGLTGAVAVGEMSRLYSAQVAEPENRDAFRVWYQAHFSELRARFPDAGQRSLPRFPATGRCDIAAADNLQQWIGPYIGTIIGGRRALAQAIEGISQCAALRTHLGEHPLAKWTETQRAP